MKEQDKINVKLQTQHDKALTYRNIEINKRLQEINADHSELRATEIFRRLGFQGNDLKKPAKQFSGG